MFQHRLRDLPLLLRAVEASDVPGQDGQALVPAGLVALLVPPLALRLGGCLFFRGLRGLRGLFLSTLLLPLFRPFRGLCVLIGAEPVPRVAGLLFVLALVDHLPVTLLGVPLLLLLLFLYDLLISRRGDIFLLVFLWNLREGLLFLLFLLLLFVMSVSISFFRLPFFDV